MKAIVWAMAITWVLVVGGGLVYAGIILVQQGHHLRANPAETETPIQTEGRHEHDFG